MLAVVLAVFFAGLPTMQAVAGPANVQYGYEPTSGAGDGSSSGSSASTKDLDGGSSALSNVKVDTPSPGFFGIITGSKLLLLALVLVVVAVGWLAWRRFSAGSDSSGMIPRLVALLAVIVALPLVAFSTSQSAQRAPAPKGFFGAITQTELEARDATRMARGGIETLRVPVEWGRIQPKNHSEFDWTRLDRIIGLAARNGISVLPFLYAPPNWSTGAFTKLPVKTSAQRRDWKIFLRAIVARYGPGGEYWETDYVDPYTETARARPIRTWQIWNEVNFFYFATPVSSKNYVSLLKSSSKTIKAMDPKAKIMLSGLYGSPPKKTVRAGKGFAASEFLRQVYKRGGKKYFDIAAVHPYTPGTKTTKSLLTKFRKVMAKNRDKKAPLSITEVGWGSGKDGFLDMGSEKAQAKQVKSAYNYFLKDRKKLRLKSVYWFVWQDYPRSRSACNFCYTTGWFKAGTWDQPLKPKPAWRAFTKFSGGKP